MATSSFFYLHREDEYFCWLATWKFKNVQAISNSNILSVQLLYVPPNLQHFIISGYSEPMHTWFLDLHVLLSDDYPRVVIIKA